METIPIYKAKAKLSSLIKQVARGKSFIISKGNKPAAQLISLSSELQAREPGSAKGQVLIGEDFNEPLEDFQSYIK